MAGKDRDKEQGKGKIGLVAIRGIKKGETLWDGGAGSVSGFGARRRAGPGVSYFVMYRTADGRQRRYTIGQHGAPWTPDTARDRALIVLAEVRGKGADPAADKKTRRESATVDDLCTDYLADAEAGRILTRRGATKKTSTLATDKGRIARHIRPLLGKSKVPAVTRADVERFMHSVAEGKTAARVKSDKKFGLAIVTGGKGTATRTMGLLGALFAYAIKKGMRSDNPVTGVVRFADNQRERRLTDAEYAMLAKGLAIVALPGKPRKDGKPPRGGMWPHALACTRFLALTGWRSGEAINLLWRHVDLEKRTAFLPDTKTGQSARPLSQAACAILRQQGRGKADSRVFPPSRGTNGMTGFPSFFERIRKAGGLPADVTPHVLRHSFASVANDLDYSEATVGMMIGHKGGGVTRKYIHAADAVLLAAADAAAAKIVIKMGENVVPFPDKAAKTVAA